MATWSIEHIPASGGASTFATLAVWGLSGLRMQFVNWGVDQASVSARGGSIAFEAAQFAYLDKLVVWRNGARFAHFWITGLGATAQRQESRTYTLSGPAWWLSQYAPSDTSNVTVYTAGAYIALGMAAAVAAGAPVGYDSGIAAALNIGCPDVRSAGTVLALVQEAARHVPFSLGWWDCSGETPILHAARRSAATAVSLAIGIDAVESFGLTPMPELQLKSVRIRFGWTGSTSYYYNVAGSDTDLSGPNRLQCALSYATQAQALEASGCGVAEKVFADMSTLPWSGALNLHATEEIDITPIRPGSALNLTGGLAEWATMGALVQSVAWSIAPEVNDCCTVELGAPDHLGVQDYFELRAAVGSAAGSESEADPVDPAADSPVPGTIDDLNGGTAQAAPTGSLITQTKGATARISGCPQLDGVETYRRWRTQTASGTLRYYYWLGNEVCAYDPTGTTVWVLSGTCQWTASDDTTVTNTLHYVDEDGVDHAISVYGAVPMPGEPHSTNLGSLTVTSTRREYSGNGACYTGHNTPADSSRMTGSNAYALADEDDEYTAYTRALTEQSAEWSSSLSSAIYTPRSTLQFERRAMRYGHGTLVRVGGTDEDPEMELQADGGYTPWGVYEITVILRWRPVDSAGAPNGDGSYSDMETRKHLVQANTDGKALLDWQDVEAPRGYEVIVGSHIIAPYV